MQVYYLKNMNKLIPAAVAAGFSFWLFQKGQASKEKEVQGGRTDVLCFMKKATQKEVTFL